MFPEGMILVDPTASVNTFKDSITSYFEKFDANVLRNEVEVNSNKIRTSAGELTNFIRES
jgi:hypothetical protein